MEAIRTQINKNPLVVGAVTGGLVGLIIGLLIGWVFWPVEYVGAYPRDLVYEQKVEYMRMAIEAYGYNKDAGQAKFRYDSLEDDADEVLTEIVQNPGNLPPTLIFEFSTVVTGAQPAVTQPAGALQSPVPGTPGVLPTVQPTVPVPAAGTETEPPKERSLLSILLPVLCVLFLAIAGVVAFLLIQRSRQRPGETVEPPAQPPDTVRQATWTDYPAQGVETPIAQFLASYKVGDDLFDDSFSIDSPSGEFLGECGVGISDTIGVGDPKKITAFEVWLFDKNDIQTVTKVVMSAHAFNNAAIRQRLEAKGEPVLSAPNAEIVLDTQTLQLVGRVVDVSYGQGAAPDESYFDSFILELSVWPK
jgi:hypothetical protein